MEGNTSDLVNTDIIVCSLPDGVLIIVRQCYRKQLQGEGMVLPFEPMTMTFKDLHYWVQIPKESAKGRDNVHMEGSSPWLELLLGISGAFRPNILTCLMGVTGAGKTTLMDVLAGRKTGQLEWLQLIALRPETLPVNAHKGWAREICDQAVLLTSFWEAMDAD